MQRYYPRAPGLRPRLRPLRCPRPPGGGVPLGRSHRLPEPRLDRPAPRAHAGGARRRPPPPRLPGDRLRAIRAEARGGPARLIGADAGEIALTTNTSYGINLAARMIPFEPGDVVLVSDGEFPANVFPWRHLADRGVTMELLPVTVEGWPDEARMLESMDDPRVRALAVSHVQFHTGYKADLARLGAAARASDTWLVVDAIQALGHVAFDVRETPVDILACGAQKWLLSPWGSGFCYVRRELIGQLVPPFAGWSAFQGTDNFTTLCDYSGPLRDDARRFELVTLPFQDLLGMVHALDLLEEIGIAGIEAHLAALGEPVLEWARRREVRVVSPEGASAPGMGG